MSITRLHLLGPTVPTAAKLPGCESPAGRQSGQSEDGGKTGCGGCRRFRRGDEHHQISMPGLMVPTAAKLPGWESPAGRQSIHARDRGKAGSMMS